MTERNGSADNILLTKLWQRKSANGRTYFSGLLGAARVVMFRDDNAEVPDGVTAIWNMYVADPRQQASKSPVSKRPPRQRRAKPQQQIRASQSGPKADEKPFQDDRLDDVLPLPGEADR